MDNQQLQVSSQDIDVHLNKDRVTNMLTMADQFHKAGCFGKDVQNTFQAFAKIQAGAEMGIPPMEAMSSLYIVNGNITMWGKALTMRLRRFGWKISYDESMPDQCKVSIVKGDEEYTYVSTKQELLDLRSRAASFALRDKLKWHAISRLCRFYVPEVLGSISYVKEEIEDVPELKGNVRVVEQTSTNLDAIEAPAVIVKDIKVKKKEEVKELATVAKKETVEPELTRESLHEMDKVQDRTPEQKKIVEDKAVQTAEEIFGVSARQANLAEFKALVEGSNFNCEKMFNAYMVSKPEELTNSQLGICIKAIQKSLES